MSLDFNPSTLDNDERVEEAARILKILVDNNITDNQLTEKEVDFIADMDGATNCSPAQLNWLRRIKDKYL